jgi:hypothetical protein
MNWIDTAQNRGRQQAQAFVKSVMNPRIPSNAEHLLTV